MQSLGTTSGLLRFNAWKPFELSSKLRGQDHWRMRNCSERASFKRKHFKSQGDEVSGERVWDLQADARAIFLR